MAETFSVTELIVPGTYIRVQSEGLIRAGGISTGNIGIVGTARLRQIGPDGQPAVDGEGAPLFDSAIYGSTAVLSNFGAAQARFGTYDPYRNASGGVVGTLNLVRSLQLIYENGGRTVFARALSPTAATRNDFAAAFAELLKDDINIVMAPELPLADALAVFGTLLENAENDGKDLIAVVGADVNTAQLSTFLTGVPNNDRIILTAPGVVGFDIASAADVNLAGGYSAAAVGGLLSSLSPQSSPTNKPLPGVTKLAQRFSYGEMKQLVAGRVMVLEERQGGGRVVRGLTTDNGAFKQVTTRRITDAAKAGIRQASEPFIGKLNNVRVRGALRGAIAGFLDAMVADEALIKYTLDVTATRDDEIAGRAIVNAIIQPTFSIDFIAVTLVLQ